MPAQTDTRTELFVMDGSSTDGTAGVVEAFGERVKHHRQETDRGIYGNANDGIAMAKGEDIAVYHADDIYHAEIVEREVAFLERYPEAGRGCCQKSFYHPPGRGAVGVVV